jgi:hypothetical protein
MYIVYVGERKEAIVYVPCVSVFMAAVSMTSVKALISWKGWKERRKETDGRKEGRKETDGRKEGRTEGRQAERQKGRKAGRQEGGKAGWEEGR